MEPTRTSEIEPITGFKRETVTYENGTVERWRENVLHGWDDLPAIEWDDGEKEWRINGILHRVGKPAIIKADGTVEYWEHGEPVDNPEVTTDNQ